MLNDAKGFASFIEKAPKVVKFDEKGSDKDKNTEEPKNEIEGRQQLHEKVIELQKTKKISYSDAIDEVTRGGK